MKLSVFRVQEVSLQNDGEMIEIRKENVEMTEQAQLAAFFTLTPTAQETRGRPAVLNCSECFTPNTLRGSESVSVFSRHISGNKRDRLK